MHTFSSNGCAYYSHLTQNYFPFSPTLQRHFYSKIVIQLKCTAIRPEVMRWIRSNKTILLAIK